MKSCHLSPLVVALLLVTGCRRSEPDIHPEPGAPPDTDTTESEDTEPTNGDTGGPRSHCYELPLLAMPGQWEDPHNPGKGQFTLFAPGDELRIYVSQGFEVFAANFATENARRGLIFALELRAIETSEIISDEAPGMSTTDYVEGTCEGLPTQSVWLLARPEDRPVHASYVCDYHGMPVRLSWTVQDPVDGRVATGAIDLVAALDELDLTWWCGYR